MSESIFKSRINYAMRYLQFDALTKSENWGDSANLFFESQVNCLPELMVLIHPRYVDRLGLTNFELFGPDNFNSAKHIVKCRSREIWGYECPFDGARIHIDHSFPRSRGGATQALNAMYLCDEHNLPKSSDVHLYPWEILPTKLSWVEPIIEKMSLAEKRISGTNFHFPKDRRKLDLK
jgi:5-methylcytosine-specific restriction endonuclease McrA